ncbi:MAG: PilT/PilU family type 4a pilus ATPase [Bdellovibrionaceae bacterium]|nr:PilT/PilU family type 4a pilus ATPase [Bdellovibrionales bacterium]MCB9253793.1 PilT/PilU family type 4a pilus ATPase [Pseudobdellovibrionaceae bacterium]
MGLPKKQVAPRAELAATPADRFDQILRRATEKKASDVHLKVGLPPIVRVNGQLYYLRDDPNTNPSAMTADQLRGMVYTLMNPRMTEKYDEGREVDLSYELPGAGRFRINICQQRSRPRIVIRYIPEAIPTLDQLSVPTTVEKLAMSSRGLILVTGATGSGKSTTLAAVMDVITRKRSCHIVTIEDPIEFMFKDRKSIVTQREVGIDTPDFGTALKYALRQDPDVILVGEMRDEETILMALSAAETGHLVLSTLHTVDATETVNRILGSVSPGIQNQIRSQLASVLVGVVSQRLLRRKDNQGRIPAVEILVSNRRVQEIISDANRTKSLREVMEESTNLGMQTFDQSLMGLYKKGLISKEEALAHCSNRRDFQLRLEGVLPGEWQDKDEKHPHETSHKSYELKGDIELDHVSDDNLDD